MESAARGAWNRDSDPTQPKGVPGLKEPRATWSPVLPPRATLLSPVPGSIKIETPDSVQPGVACGRAPEEALFMQGLGVHLQGLQGASDPKTENPSPNPTQVSSLPLCTGVNTALQRPHPSSQRPHPPTPALASRPSPSGPARTHNDCLLSHLRPASPEGKLRISGLKPQVCACPHG